MEPIPIRRSKVVLAPDPERILTRPYFPGESGPVVGASRIQRLVDRIVGLPDDAVAPTLAGVRERFRDRHHDLDAALEQSLSVLRTEAEVPSGISHDLGRLLGAYFLHEYSIEAAALTNPSIVPAPDQSIAPPGCLRVIISLRAVGEGHISSVELRTGVVDEDGEVHVDSPEPALLGHREPPLFDKSVFVATLQELLEGSLPADEPDGPTRAPERRRNPAESALEPLDDRFTMGELEQALRTFRLPGMGPDITALARTTIHWLASSNYELSFSANSHLSQRVLFPVGPAESHGMEDARFVRFTDDDGTARYLGTYTAYDGFHVLPQLIETQDFSTFRMATLTGAAARNKGIAIFPRRIAGRYVALARTDAENNHLMWSDHLRLWEESAVIQVPVRPWELVQLGNAGGPIETEAGWLMITHGVGPLRTYALGALLLDLDDPSRVIGHLPEPLLFPQPDEREGYVPNVVYSCGQVEHAGRLVIAYGASDTTSRFASLPIDTLLHELTSRSSWVA